MDLRSQLIGSKTAKVLMSLNSKRMYINEITKKCGISAYTHTWKILKLLSENNLVISEKKGRQKYYELTEKGKKLSDKLCELRSLLRDLDGR